MTEIDTATLAAQAKVAEAIPKLLDVERRALDQAIANVSVLRDRLGDHVAALQLAHEDERDHYELSVEELDALDQAAVRLREMSDAFHAYCDEIVRAVQAREDTLHATLR